MALPVVKPVVTNVACWMPPERKADIVMEIVFYILLALLGYVLTMYFAVKITKEKLGARSALFGIGVASMFTGFLWNKVLMEIAIDDFIYWWYRAEPLYYVLSFGSLILGISGIVMMAVDILKAIDELTAWTVKKDTPVWKQTQIGHQSDK